LPSELSSSFLSSLHFEAASNAGNSNLSNSCSAAEAKVGVAAPNEIVSIAVAAMCAAVPSAVAVAVESVPHLLSFSYTSS
jgi:hypothetical protein